MGADVSSIHLKTSKCSIPHRNHVISEPMGAPAAIAERNSILMLNDDCFKHIFHMLALYDLNAIGKTCKRL